MDDVIESLALIYIEKHTDLRKSELRYKMVQDVKSSFDKVVKKLIENKVIAEEGGYLKKHHPVKIIKLRIRKTVLNILCKENAIGLDDIQECMKKKHKYITKKDISNTLDELKSLHKAHKCQHNVWRPNAPNILLGVTIEYTLCRICGHETRDVKRNRKRKSKSLTKSANKKIIMGVTSAKKSNKSTVESSVQRQVIEVLQSEDLKLQCGIKLKSSPLAANVVTVDENFSQRQVIEVPKCEDSKLQCGIKKLKSSPIAANVVPHDESLAQRQVIEMPQSDDSKLQPVIKQTVTDSSEETSDEVESDEEEKKLSTLEKLFKCCK